MNGDVVKRARKPISRAARPISRFRLWIYDSYESISELFASVLVNSKPWSLLCGIPTLRRRSFAFISTLFSSIKGRSNCFAKYSAASVKLLRVNTGTRASDEACESNECGSAFNLVLIVPCHRAFFCQYHFRQIFVVIPWNSSTFLRQFVSSKCERALRTVHWSLTPLNQALFPHGSVGLTKRNELDSVILLSHSMETVVSPLKPECVYSPMRIIATYRCTRTHTHPPKWCAGALLKS